MFSRLETKQDQSLTDWRVKDNHFSRLENKANPVTHRLESQGQPFSAGFENNASTVTHRLESQGQPFSAGLKTKQALSLTS